MKFKIICGAVCLLCVAFLISIVLFAKRNIFTRESFENTKEGELVSLNDLNDSENNIFFIEFYADWCPFCKKIEGIWNKVYKNYNTEKHKDGKIIRVIQISDKNPHLKEFKQKFDFDIDGFPTIILMKNQVIEKYTGTRSYESLSTYLEK